MNDPIVPIEAGDYLQDVSEHLMQAAKALDRAREACAGCDADKFLEMLGSSLVGVHAGVERLVATAIRGTANRRQEPR